MSSGGMTVEVRTIPQAGLDRAWTCSAEDLALDRDAVDLYGAAVVTMHIARNGREVRAQGEVRARAGLTCSRCLEPFPTDMVLPFDVVFLPGGEGDSTAREADLQPDMGLAWYDGVHIDLQREVRDIVMLSQPMTPRCRPDCRGLCARCGANLNAGPCGCPAEPSSSPFAALGELKAQLAAKAAAEHKDEYHGPT